MPRERESTCVCEKAGERERGGGALRQGKSGPNFSIVSRGAASAAVEPARIDVSIFTPFAFRGKT